MARIKSGSPAMEKAQKRAAALAAVQPALDLGGGMTLAAYRQAIRDVEENLENYNNLLSKVDEALNELRRTERALNDWSERMLVGVAARYGKDSNEYEMAGGVRKSERRKRLPKQKTPAAA